MAAIQEAKLVEAIAPSIQGAARRKSADRESAAPVARWPKALDSAALHGVAGELVKRLDPHTEADPAAILFQLLVAFGNLIGRAVYFVVEAQKHYCNMNAVLVGKTSKARKGISWGRVRGLLTAID